MNHYISSPPSPPPISSYNTYTSWTGGVDPTAALFKSDNQFGGGRSRKSSKTRKSKRTPGKYKYHGTTMGLMNWAISELEHVGRIASIEDENVQYSYAMSTLNGMAHLKDAIFEYVSEHPNNHMNDDLLVFHEKVIRVMKHLIKVYSLDVGAIEAFNTRGILSNLNYLRSKSRKS